MEEELMFSMEEEGSIKRPPVQGGAFKKRASSLSDANASDDEDDDEDHFICPILEDSAKEVCHYLKNLVYKQQLSNSLPKNSFTYKVSWQRDADRTARGLLVGSAIVCVNISL